MKKLIALSVIILTLANLPAQSGIIYVKQGSNGDGASWNKAFGDLQAALLQAKTGQEIWVAAGTYYPTQDNNRKMVFRIRNSIRLYGGFSGKETSRSERDWKKNLTILSGEIGAPGSADNSYTVVYTHQVNSQTTIDGFAITGGFSDGAADPGTIERSGGGWFNDGSGGVSSPTIANCLFIDNFAREGAALYNFASGGICRPHIINCQFVSNRALLEGAGIFNDGRNGNASPAVDESYFLDNTAKYGAAIRNLADNGEATPVISYSIFESNMATVREIVYNGSQANSKCKALLRSCRFFDNEVSMGNNGNNADDVVKMKGYRRNGEILYLPAHKPLKP